LSQTETPSLGEKKGKKGEMRVKRGKRWKKKAREKEEKITNFYLNKLRLKRVNVNPRLKLIRSVY